MRSQLIRDSLVVGLLDRALQEKLHLNAELTLEKAKRMVNQNKLFEIIRKA